MRKYFLDETTLRELVSRSTSMSQVLQAVGLVAKGGNYAVMKSRLAKLQNSTLHFTGQASNKGKKFPPKRELSEYLENKHSITSHSLRKRLLSEKLLEYKCYNCKLSTWLEQPIPLELHHVDGNHANNSLGNLELLCSNCHALTPNFRRSKKLNV